MDLITLALAVQKTLGELGVKVKTERTLIELIQQTEISFAAGESNLYTAISEGTIYEVTFDGVVYICKAYPLEFNGDHATILGNGVLFGSEDTGEPFRQIFR